MSRTSVGLFLRSLDNDYQQLLRDDAVATAARVGLQLKVFAAANHAARQLEQISGYLAGPAAADLAAILVSAVRDDDLAAVARAAAQAGVGWVLLNRDADYLATLSQDHPSLPIFSVTPDQDQIGRIQGRQARALVPGGGSLVCLTGHPGTSSARKRLGGLRDELRDVGFQITPIEGDWTSEGARLAMQSWLDDAAADAPLPAIVVAQNDEMAQGARQALRDAADRFEKPALAHVPLIGCDGSPALGQRLVRDKKILATVKLPSAAGPALQCLAAVRDGGERPALHVTLPVSSFPDLAQLAPV